MEKKKRTYKANRKPANRKSKAREGYVTLAQAVEITGIPESTFKYYVKIGRIPRMVPEFKVGMKKPNGYYPLDAVHEVAQTYHALVAVKGAKPVIDEAVLIDHDHIEARPARPEDEEGVVAILTDRGWPAASAEQRRSWLESNPLIDYIVLAPDATGKPRVRGYIYAAPFPPETMQAFMNGRMRGKDARPEDHPAYEVDETYDLYVGIATEEIGKGPQGESLTNPVYGAKLLTGFLGFLQDLARHGTRIRHLYALSDQPHAMEMCERLGFEAYGTTSFYDAPQQHPTQYRLDLEHSQARFARLYRQALE